MHCNVIRDLLPLYADELTSPETGAFIEQHLRECEECRKIWAHMQAPEEKQVWEDETDKLIQALRQQKLRTRAAAACLTVLLSLGFFLLWWVPARTRFVTYKTKLDSTDPVVILREEPAVAVTPEEIALGTVLLSLPAVQVALAALTPDILSAPLSSVQVDAVLSEHLPADAHVTEILVRQNGILVTYTHNGARLILEYVDGDGTGYVDMLHKTFAAPDVKGKTRYVYSVIYHTAVDRAEYERWEQFPRKTSAS